MLLRTASDTGAVLSFWAFFPPEIFLFWQVVTFQNIEIIFDVIQCCELRFRDGVFIYTSAGISSDGVVQNSKLRFKTIGAAEQTGIVDVELELIPIGIRF